MLQTYLEKIGLNDKESAIYVSLAEIGVQPASVIARRSGLDRVTAYKHLKKLAERGLVKVYSRDGIQCFGIENFEAIESYLKDRAGEYDDLLKKFPNALEVLRSLKHEEDLVPKLQLFEGEAGMKSLFRDMLHEVKNEEVQLIRALSANTFEEWEGDVALKKTVRTFFQDLQKNNISIELFEVTGSLVPERLKRVPESELDISKVPIARGTTSIFIVAHTVYLATYKGGQAGLKIKQAQLSQLFHFLFDIVGKKV